MLPVINDRLEALVDERTSQLNMTIEELRNEAAVRKRAEEALILFRTLIDHTNDAIEVVDPETGRFLDVNEKACLAHGYTREEYLSLTVPEIDPLVAARGWKETRDEVRRSGSHILETQHRRKDGSVFPVEVNVTYIHLNRDYFLAVVRDITERKRAEDALRVSEQRLRAMFDEAATGFALADPQGRFVQVNRKYCAITGYTEQELYEMDFPSITHPDDRPGNMESIWQLLAGEIQSFVIEKRYAKKSGEVVWVQNSVSALRDAKGNVVNITAIVEDITERKRAEEALRAANERLHTIIQASPLAITCIDASGRITSWNAGAERMFGWSEREAIGRVCPTVPPEGLEDYHSMIARVMKGETVGGLVRYRKKKDGALIDANIYSAPLRNAAGEITGLIVIVEDITERKRAQEIQAKLLQKVITVQEEERKRLARELHDETGQALTSLLIGLRAIQDSRALKEAKVRAVRLRKVTSQAMKEVQRLAQGLRPIMLDDLGLDAALKRYASDFARTHGIAVEVDTIGLDSERLPANMETTLFRIAQEALTNTVKHAAAKHVNIFLNRSLSDIQMIVEDDGVGFIPGPDPKTATTPTRLGLYGMRERVGMLGGVVAIESAPGEGTTIHVRIPLERRTT